MIIKKKQQLMGLIGGNRLKAEHLNLSIIII